MKAHAGIQRASTAHFDLAGRLFEKCGADGGDVMIPDIFDTCTFCESIGFSDLIRAFDTPGTQYATLPWNDYPRGFTIQIPCTPYHEPFILKQKGVGTIEWAECTFKWHKFLIEHLKDATDKELQVWREVGTPMTGILFQRVKVTGKIAWFAPQKGFVTWGVVGRGNDPDAPSIEGPLVDIGGRKVS